LLDSLQYHLRLPEVTPRLSDLILPCSIHPLSLTAALLVGYILAKKKVMDLSGHSPNALTEPSCGICAPWSLSGRVVSGSVPISCYFLVPSIVSGV
jgi:hypothetical protein